MNLKKSKGRLWTRSLGMAAALLCAWTGFAGAAVDPAYAAKAERTRNQMEQRVSNEERQAAADSLQAWRQDVAAAKLLYKKDAKTTSGPSKGIALIDYDTIPTEPNQLLRNGQPKPPDYYTTANWAYSPSLTKFVDTLPGVGPDNKNNLQNYISVAVADTESYPGSDYYEIDLVEYRQQMHSDLPESGTLLRGYVQANLAADGTATCGGKTGVTCPSEYVEPPRYLGATIVAQRDRPVRIKFTNKLPVGSAGDLFIPVDKSVMGAGMGPLTGVAGQRGGGTECRNDQDQPCDYYTENRATIHLHGGRTPWISDGTPHQWITPADEKTPYPQGVSVANVPDMEDPGDGSMTFYYTNQQTARLMFYHDHAFGITRLNVYAGQAAGYLVQDEYELDLVDRGIIPADIIPLVIQDKTFVDASEIRKYDPLWNWGSRTEIEKIGENGKPIYKPVEGDLWLPHVYMPAQFPENPDLSGVSAFGRWMYGPWFYPPTVIKHGPVANPYHDPDCSSTNPYILADCQTPGQNSLNPATPHPSMGMEAFSDTAVVNGTAFPVMEVEPRAYRFRILSAANDRGFNLSFYKADGTGVTPDNRRKSNLTEVKMVDAAVTPGWPELWPTDGRVEGVPDPGTPLGNGRWSNWGPSFIQIGTDAGFLPKPVIRDPQPVTWITDPTAFWVGVVKDTALGLMPAERADVIVDFCDYAGQTLILYNDAPAAWPAGVWNYDYYTGAPDRRDSGGYGAGGTFNPITGVYDNGVGILPGYGPNSRTVMQVVVKPGACSPYDYDALEAEFTSAAPSGTPLFERAMEPVIVGQDYYNSAYNLDGFTFPSSAPWRGTRSDLTQRSLKFFTVDGDRIEIPMKPKAIHDEMGASFDPEYGRMSGNLGTELDPPTTNNANMNIYGFSDLPTEIINNSEGAKIQIDSLGQLADGTQIWNVSHNGVDTHPVHFHIFDVQLINRIGWDGQLALPEPNEYGWKDTVRISPLMDTIVAVRPVAPLLPFGITNSIRPLNPSLPIGSGMGFNSADPVTGEVLNIVTNRLHNFGWEYVWHCHILSHEEMDMMRPIILQYAALAADEFFLDQPVENGSSVDLSWSDPSPVNYENLPDYTTGDPGDYGNPTNEVGFTVWSSANGGPYTKVGSALANQTVATVPGSTSDLFVIEALNAGGSTYSHALSTVDLTINGPFAAPANLTLSTVVGAPFNQQVTRVEYYHGVNQLTDPLNPLTTPPYTFNWNGVQQGNYTITAKAIDSVTGLVAFSEIIPVTVTSGLTADFTVNGGNEIGVCDTGTLYDASSGGTITAWNWLVNGVTYTTQNPVLPTLPAGIYPVTLKVTGTSGEIAQVTKSVEIVNHPPTAEAGGPYTLNFNGTVELTGTGADPLDPCNTLTYAWDIDSNGTYDYFTQNRTIKFSVIQPWIGSGDRTITFKVTDSSGASTTSTATLTVGPVPIIATALTSPNGGEVLTSGQIHAVTWVPGTYAAKYNLWYSKDNKATWIPIVNGVTGSSYNWTVPVVAAGTPNCYFMVKAYQTDGTWIGNYQSAAPFNINPAVVLTTITNPNGGETLTSSSVYAVNWVSGTNAAKFNLWYSKDNKATWVPIVNGLTGSSYNWTVPVVAAGTPNCYFMIKAYKADGTWVGNYQSAAPFTINPSALPSTITNPNGGEVLTSSSVYAVNWVPGTNAAKFNLWYSTDNKANWISIANGVTDSSYNWTVPVVGASAPQSYFMIKTYKADGTWIGNYQSAAPFTINP